MIKSFPPLVSNQTNFSTPEFDSIYYNPPESLSDDQDDRSYHDPRSREVRLSVSKASSCGHTVWLTDVFRMDKVLTLESISSLNRNHLLQKLQVHVSFLILKKSYPRVKLNDSGIQKLKENARKQHFWCSISYYELGERVGEVWNAPNDLTSIVIDGFTNPNDGAGAPNRFSLG